MGTTYCGALVGTCIDATITFGEDIAKEELEPYLKLDQEIIFRVKAFDASHCFIDGTVDENCLEKIKEFIPIKDEFNGLYSLLVLNKFNYSYIYFQRRLRIHRFSNSFIIYSFTLV